jgi:hypothetical protein
MTGNDGIMAADMTIKLNPTTSVLRHQVWDEIRLSEEDSLQLSKAFFAEIDSKVPVGVSCSPTSRRR